MNSYKFSEIYNKLEESCNNRDNIKIEDALTEYFKDDKDNSTVLGIDVYRYSQYEPTQQRMIPIVLGSLFNFVGGSVASEETLIFCNVDEPIKEYFKKRFIDTGDGGFFILENPLQAIVFALYFELYARVFNTGNVFPGCRQFLKEFSSRYCITTGAVYSYDYFGGRKNYYGKAIIDNARILSKDKLNRCLIDKASHDWFYDHMQGIENLRTAKLENIKSIDYIKRHKGKDTLTCGMFSDKKENSINKIDKIDILKIGKTEAKKEIFDIYNLHIQAITEYNNYLHAITLGNLNTAGIDFNEGHQ